jgi:hypothetical protein
MKEFFRGWKRKVGVVTLLMACVFAGGWVRGYSMYDSLALGQTRWSTSRYGIMVIKRFETSGAPIRERTEWGSSSLVDFGDMNPIDANFSHASFNWRWTRLGFDFLEVNQTSPASVMTIWAIPYWSIIAPLALLSVHLLLSKPQPQ